MNLSAVAVFLAISLAACNKTSVARDDGTPSGQPVPRYLSLQDDQVNARAGPGTDYPIKWTYHAKGLPVQVIAETEDWRRICDPFGERSWVKSTGVQGERTVVRLAKTPLPLRASPKVDAPVRAYLQPQAVAALDREVPGWLRLEAGGVKAWAPIDQVWGAAPSPQCR